MKSTQEAQLRAMFENDFNQASNPIPQAEFDYETAKARLEAMLNNGQKLDPPLTLSQGQQPLTPENTPDPLRPGDKVGAIDGQQEQKQDDLYKLNDQQSYKALADEIDAFAASGQPIPQAQPAPLTREEIQALMAEEIRLWKTRELAYYPPPQPPEPPAPPPKDWLAPDPVEQMRADVAREDAILANQDESAAMTIQAQKQDARSPVPSLLQPTPEELKAEQGRLIAGLEKPAHTLSVPTPPGMTQDMDDLRRANLARLSRELSMPPPPPEPPAAPPKDWLAPDPVEQMRADVAREDAILASQEQEIEPE